MKKFLSMILATLMVLSLATVFTVASSATEGLTGLTVTMGTTYAEAGSTAYVDLYISADSLPAAYARLRDWQFAFEGAQVGKEPIYNVIKDGAAGLAYAFVNEGTNTIGCTTDVGDYVASAAQITCPGGMYIASIQFIVPEDATGSIEISVAAVNAIDFEDTDVNQYAEKDAEVTFVSGQIIIVDSVKGTSADVEGEGQDYIVPDFDGNIRITSMLNEDGDPALIGEFGTLTIPASILDLADGLDEVEAATAVILKSTSLEDGDAKAVASLGDKNDPLPVYILKRANGIDTTADAFASLSNTNKAKVDVRYLLQAVNAVSVDGSSVYFTGAIAADDLGFDSITLSITFVEEGKTFAAPVDIVYTTVTDCASVDEDTATMQGITYAEGMAYLTGAVVNGVPSGNYTVELTVYGTTADKGGNTVVVCGETITVSVTV